MQLVQGSVTAAQVLGPDCRNPLVQTLTPGGTTKARPQMPCLQRIDSLLPFVGFLVDRYGLSSHLVDATLVALVSLIPSVFLIAYNHGAPGKDPWLRAEHVGVPVNMVLASGLVLWVVFAGPRAEAMTETVVVTDEHELRGRRVQFVVEPGHDDALGIHRRGMPDRQRRADRAAPDCIRADCIQADCIQADRTQTGPVQEGCRQESCRQESGAKGCRPGCR